MYCKEEWLLKIFTISYAMTVSNFRYTIIYYKLRACGVPNRYGTMHINDSYKIILNVEYKYVISLDKFK